MNKKQSPTADSTWLCATCGKPLTPGKVTVTYLGNDFPVELLRCHSCGLVLVTEDLALGKMAMVEQNLEDK